MAEGGSQTKQGIVAGLLAYTMWGFMPGYWKALQSVPPLEILCHRTIWSFVFLLFVLAARKQWAWVGQVSATPRILYLSLGSACLLSPNWLIYIWAVNSGHVVDSSLGYFVTPLASVLLGVLFLRERLRLWQIVAIAVAALGVLALTVGYGGFPSIALGLAFTFSFYGLLRKVSPLGSLEGLSLETVVLSLPAAAYLIYQEVQGGGAFGHAGTATTLLLVGTGLVTALPLLLFAHAARQVKLATIGFLQYVSPAFQFVLGVLAYSEPFTTERLWGFAPIWMALLIYSLEGLKEEWQHRPGPARQPGGRSRGKGAARGSGALPGGR